MKEKLGFGLALIAGALLMIGGVVGSADIYEKALAFAQQFFEGNLATLLGMAGIAVAFLASLGGIAVIAGGILIYGKHYLTGRLIIGLGAGAAVFSLAGSFVVNVFNGVNVIDFILQTASTTAGLGTILALGVLLISRD